KPDLAEHLAPADHRALGIDLDQILVVDQPLRRSGWRGHEPIAIARGDVAVVVRRPAVRVDRSRSLGDRGAEQPHAMSTASTMPTIAERIGTTSPCCSNWRTPVPSVNTITRSPAPACARSIAT